MKNINIKFSFTSFVDEKNVKGISHKLTQNQILEFITANNYSAVKFNRNRRLKKNAQNTRIIVLDIDDIQPDNKTLKDVSKSISNLNHIIATTRSHQLNKNGIICDRYRIILFTQNEIVSADEYKRYIYQFGEQFGLTFDKKAVDIGRLFYKSQTIVSHNFEGENLEIKRELDSTTVNPKPAVKEIAYRLAKCELPDFLKDWIFKFKNLSVSQIDKREKFIRFLLAQKHLVIRNPIPQETVAKFLQVERLTLRSWIKDFEEYNWLIIVSNDYGKGWKSRDYAVSGDLFEYMMALHKFKNKRDCYSQLKLPTSIPDGQWHNDLYHFSFCFSGDPDDVKFLEWVKTIPGWDKKTRLLQAKNAFKGMKESFEL